MGPHRTEKPIEIFALVGGRSVVVFLLSVVAGFFEYLKHCAAKARKGEGKATEPKPPADR